MTASAPWPLPHIPVTCVLGVDPGVVTGVAWLSAPGEVLVFQCNAPGAYPLVSWLLEANEGPARVIAAGEAFIAGRGPGARGANATVTRQVIADLGSLPVTWHWRTAGQVKPWATDRRLAAAGLLQECHGMPHAADGARHLLYSACHDGGYPDPLSKAARMATMRARPLTRRELEKHTVDCQPEKGPDYCAGHE